MLIYLYNIIMKNQGLKKDQQQVQHLHDSHEHQDKQSDKNESTHGSAIVYGEFPIAMKCPYCLQHIRTEIISRPETISVVLGFTCLAIVPNMLMMFFGLLLMQITASKKHRCALCERQLGNDGKFLVYFTDEVYSFAFFSSGLIFTKKMLVTGLMIAFALVIVSIRGSMFENEKFVDIGWKDYLSQCTEDNANLCLRKYRIKEFKNWEGFVLKVTDNRQSTRKYYIHAVSIFMKMQPALYNDTRPDILLTLSNEALYYNEEAIRALKHGDHIRFNSTLHQRYNGNLKDVMHFHLDTLEVIGHDDSIPMFTSDAEEEWIQIHVEDKSRLTSEPDPSTPKKQIPIP